MDGLMIKNLINEAVTYHMEAMRTEDNSECAAIAATSQAASLAAIAAMMFQMTTTGENVTTGETIRWLRVDTGN